MKEGMGWGRLHRDYVYSEHTLSLMESHKTCSQRATSVGGDVSFPMRTMAGWKQTCHHLYCPLQSGSSGPISDNDSLSFSVLSILREVLLVSWCISPHGRNAEIFKASFTPKEQKWDSKVRVLHDSQSGEIWHSSLEI